MNLFECIGACVAIGLSAALFAAGAVMTLSAVQGMLGMAQ